MRKIQANTPRGRKPLSSANIRKNKKTISYCNTCFKAFLASVVIAFAIIFAVIAAGIFYSWSIFGFSGSPTAPDAAYVNWFDKIRIIGIPKTSTDFRDELTAIKRLLRKPQHDALSSSNGAETEAQSVLSKSLFQTVPSISQSDPPAALVEARKVLDNHPLRHLFLNQSNGNISLEAAMLYLSKQPQCKDTPIFTSMAQVGTDLYWQLIENFVYTMVKFALSDCSIMICVTDRHCMDLCAMSGFPCLYYDHAFHNPDQPLPSALEQIAHLKLRHLPKALGLGVNILMMDLDVGFLQNPMKLIEGFFDPKNRLFKVDIMVQKDITFIMHRSVELWRTWFTEPMPNIGLFLIRGVPKTERMFSFAWEDYKSITANIKHNPGKDQNKVVEAMKSTPNLHWAYFSTNNAILLDKIYKFEDKTFELGGKAAADIFRNKDTVAVHTTCYEQKSKVMGLKAANAFWNPQYYDPNRRTITKKLLHSEWSDFSNELRSLMYLAVVTDRTLIIPNVLGADDIVGVDVYNNLVMWPGFRVAHVRQAKKKSNGIQLQESEEEETQERSPRSNLRISNFFFNEKNVREEVRQKVLGPESIVLSSLLSIVEPAFYWRVKRDYSSKVPDPSIISFLKSVSLTDIEQFLLLPHVAKLPRIVINMDTYSRNPKNSKNKNIDGLNNSNSSSSRENIIHSRVISYHVHVSTIRRLAAWAGDSVGSYKKYSQESHEYVAIPKLHSDSKRSKLKNLLREIIIDDVRPCDRILQAMKGNRSCFDKCQ